MQIHEITQQQLEEGLADFAKSAGQNISKGAKAVGKKVGPLAKSAGQKLGKAYNAFANTTVGGDIVNAVASPFQKAHAAITTPGGLTSASGYASAMDNYYRAQNATLAPQVTQAVSGRVAQQTQARAKQLTKQWLQQVKPTPTAAPAPVAAPTTAPTPTVNAPKAKPGQMPAGVASSAQGKKMQQLYGKPKGGIQNIPSDLEEATAVTAQQFQQWADSQLATQMSGTNKTITMAQVRQQDKAAAQALSAALTAITKNPSDPVAVENYFMTAMTAMQKLAKQSKQSNSPTSSAGPLSTLLSPQAISTIKNLAQDPAQNSAIKQTLGLR